MMGPQRYNWSYQSLWKWRLQVGMIYHTYIHEGVGQPPPHFVGFVLTVPVLDAIAIPFPPESRAKFHPQCIHLAAVHDTTVLIRVIYVVTKLPVRNAATCDCYKTSAVPRNFDFDFVWLLVKRVGQINQSVKGMLCYRTFDISHFVSHACCCLLSLLKLKLLLE